VKTIFISAKDKEQAEEYIKNYVKVVTNVARLEGYDKNNILIVLPKEEVTDGVIEEAKMREFNIIHA